MQVKRRLKGEELLTLGSDSLMRRVEIAKDVYWVGAVDWNIRNFHGYKTQRGSTYNAYLIVDEKVTLIDTVKASFFNEMVKRISEMDHSGSIPMMMELAENAVLVCSERGKDSLLKHYGRGFNFKVVKTGDELSIGENRLNFIEVPMLHWPDSMATYLPEHNILFSNDAFGQHLATSVRFNDEVSKEIVMHESAKYYANIVMHLSSIVLRALDAVKGLKVKMIAPSHGVIWRSNIGEILSAYERWATGDSDKRVIIVYDTMWGSTEMMAKAILEGVTAGEIECSLYNLSKTDKSDVIKEVLEAKGIVIGSPTLNSGAFPTVSEFLSYMKGLKPKNRVGWAFGSFGWGGGAVKEIEHYLRETRVEFVESIAVKYRPDEDELKRCFEFGRSIADKVKG